MFSYMESRFQGKDNGNSTMAGCIESRIAKLKSLVLGMENENSTMGCLESRNSNLESLVFKPERRCSILFMTLVSISIMNQSRSDFHKYSAVNISSGCLHLSSGGENVEEGNGRGCLDVIQSQHGSSSQDQLDMSKKLFVNLVSDNGGQSLGESEDSDTSTDSGTSLGGLMDMLAMKYRNRNDDKEMKWKSEADMLSSFEEDPELCMRAVCALHRQQISEDEISAKGLFHFSDVLRITTLANFLMEEECKGDLKKSLKELEIFGPEGVVDCKRMARRYWFQLFSVYQNGKDPSFLPPTTASRGD